MVILMGLSLLWLGVQYIVFELQYTVGKVFSGLIWLMFKMFPESVWVSLSVDLWHFAMVSWKFLCGGLNEKSPHRLTHLNTGSAFGGAVRKDCGTFWRWNLDGGSMVLVTALLPMHGWNHFSASCSCIMPRFPARMDSHLSWTTHPNIILLI